MIERCPECNEKISLLLTQGKITEEKIPYSERDEEVSDSDMTILDDNCSTYKCPNPECWVTKIKESWE